MRMLVDSARTHGIAGYPLEGRTRWTGVHVEDAAVLIRLALERAPAGAVMHFAETEGFTQRALASCIGQRYDLPVQSIAQDQLMPHFGPLVHCVCVRRRQQLTCSPGPDADPRCAGLDRHHATAERLVARQAHAAARDRRRRLRPGARGLTGPLIFITSLVHLFVMRSSCPRASSSGELRLPVITGEGRTDTHPAFWPADESR